MTDNNAYARVQLAATAAHLLEHDPNYRVLRRIPNPEARHMSRVALDCQVIAIVDTETTGLDIERDEITEFAIMLVFVEQDGRLRGWTGPHAWLQEPSVPLTPDVQRLTGLTDSMLAGQRIDDEFAVGLLERADVIIAHNARFDSAFVERRFPEIAGKAWACSADEIDWRALGFEGRGLQNLLLQSGWFTDAHRAAADVWSTFWLLTSCGEGEGSYLQQLLAASAQPTGRVEARPQSSSARSALKARGYRWHPQLRFWWKEVASSEVVSECGWFASVGERQPHVSTVTACTRHRPIKPDLAQLAINRAKFDAPDDTVPF